MLIASPLPQILTEEILGAFVPRAVMQPLAIFDQYWVTTPNRNGVGVLSSQRSPISSPPLSPIGKTLNPLKEEGFGSVAASTISCDSPSPKWLKSALQVELVGFIVTANILRSPLSNVAKGNTTSCFADEWRWS